MEVVYAYVDVEARETESLHILLEERVSDGDVLDLQIVLFLIVTVAERLYIAWRRGRRCFRDARGVQYFTPWI